MLNSGKNILTLVLSEKKILNEKKNHTPSPPFKLNGRSLSRSLYFLLTFVYWPLYLLSVNNLRFLFTPYVSSNVPSKRFAIGFLIKTNSI